MQLISSKDRSTRKGPADWFTGDVWIDEIVVGATPSRLRNFRVSFAPAARTAWHTHPAGQTIHVLSGIGRVQVKSQPVREIYAGDTAIFAPDELHWHGAAPGRFMVHLAVQECDEDGIDVRWLAHVTDAEYDAGTA